MFLKDAIIERTDFILTALQIILIITVAYVVCPYLGIHLPDGRKFEKYGAIEYSLTSKKHTEKIELLLQEMGSRCDKLVERSHEIEWPDCEDTPKNVNETPADRLKKRWSKIRLRETKPHESTIAYIVNKDYELRICLTDKEEREPEELNTAMFVILHELGHMASIKYGHGPEFWNNFRAILKKAIEIGIYTFRDYSDRSTVYCGLSIYSTPCDTSECEQTCNK